MLRLESLSHFIPLPLKIMRRVEVLLVASRRLLRMSFCFFTMPFFKV